MAKTNWQDPKTGEIISPQISGLQEAVGKLEESINIETVTETNIPLSEIFISNDDRCRIYQAPEGKRNWVVSPAPIIKKNGIVITEDFTIEYGGGGVVFTVPILPSDALTANVTYTKKIDGKQLSANDYSNLEKQKNQDNEDNIIDLAGVGRVDETVVGNSKKIGPLASLLTRIKDNIVNALNGVQEDLDAHKAENVTYYSSTIVRDLTISGVQTISSLPFVPELVVIECIVSNTNKFSLGRVTKTDQYAYAQVQDTKGWVRSPNYAIRMLDTAVARTVATAIINSDKTISINWVVENGGAIGTADFRIIAFAHGGA